MMALPKPRSGPLPLRAPTAGALRASASATRVSWPWAWCPGRRRGRGQHPGRPQPPSRRAPRHRRAASGHGHRRSSRDRSRPRYGSGGSSSRSRSPESRPSSATSPAAACRNVGSATRAQPGRHRGDRRWTSAPQLDRGHPGGHGSSGSSSMRSTAEPTGMDSPGLGSWPWTIQLSSGGRSSG